MKMKHIHFLTTAFFTLLFLKLQCQPVEDILPKWKYLNNDAKVSLYKYFAGQAFSLLDKRKSDLEKINSKQGWLARQSYVQKKYAEIMGKFPSKTPLNPVVTGIITQAGVRVEKLYFESIPGYYVTGALFLPADRKGKLPAILYCSGHSESGFRAKPYQHTILNLVKKGFAVFAFDPIGQGERRQYLDDEQHKSFGPTQEHSYSGSQLFLLGRTPAYYFIWDGIRAVDYLYSRPEIDTTRIGITGRSGGGTQTAYIASFDNRIKAAAPECYVTSFEKLLMTMGPQDAEQNFTNSIYYGLDIGDLVISFAPKPMLLITTTRDIFSIQGARDVFKEAHRAYSLIGKPDHLQMVEDDAEHTSTLKNREAMYRFFQKYLSNPGTFADENVSLYQEKELYVTPEWNIYETLKGHNLHTLAASYLKEICTERTVINGFEDLGKRVEKLTGYYELKKHETPVFCGRYHRESYVVESYLLKSITGSYFPVYRLTPKQRKIQKNPVLLLDDNGKGEAVKEGGYAESLALLGHEVIVPDLSGFGELSNGYIKDGDAWVDNTPLNLWYMAILIKQSLLTVRMHELSMLIDWISGSNTKIETIANGVLATDLLHIAIIRNKQIASVLLLNPPASYRSVVEVPDYKTRYLLSAVPGMLSQYDNEDLIKFLSARVRTMLVKPKNGAGFTIKPFNNNNTITHKDALRILYDDLPAKQLDDWYASPF